MRKQDFPGHRQSLSFVQRVFELLPLQGFGLNFYSLGNFLSATAVRHLTIFKVEAVSELQVCVGFLCGSQITVQTVYTLESFSAHTLPWPTVRQAGPFLHSLSFSSVSPLLFFLFFSAVFHVAQADLKLWIPDSMIQVLQKKYELPRLALRTEDFEFLAGLGNTVIPHPKTRTKTKIKQQQKQKKRQGKNGGCVCGGGTFLELCVLFHLKFPC